MIPYIFNIFFLAFVIINNIKYIYYIYIYIILICEHSVDTPCNAFIFLSVEECVPLHVVNFAFCIFMTAGSEYNIISVKGNDKCTLHLLQVRKWKDRKRKKKTWVLGKRLIISTEFRSHDYIIIYAAIEKVKDWQIERKSLRRNRNKIRFKQIRNCILGDYNY